MKESRSKSQAIGFLLVLTGCGIPHLAAESRTTGTRTVLFACPHNAAKSIMAASYFNEGAARRGLAVRSVSAGTHPNDQISTAVAALLRTDGMDVSGQKPRQVDQHDLRTADLVVSLGCDDLRSSVPVGVEFESWNDVPPPVTDLPGTRRSIQRHVQELLARLAGQHD